MSLLNDALRAAEERQQRPDVSGAYTGGAVQRSQDGSRWPVVFLLLLILGIAGAGVYWVMFSGSSSTSTVAENPVASAEQGSIEREPQPQMPEPQTKKAEPKPQSPEPKPVAERSELPVLPNAPAERAEAVVVATPKVVATPRVDDAKRQETKPSPEPVQTVDVAEPVSRNKTPEPEMAESTQQVVQSPEGQSSEAPVVKTTPQTPAAIDRQTARELERLVSGGQMVAAERQLASLTQSQTAPRSRFVVARALLVDGDVNRALSWMPEAAAANDPSLRMLRARAQHADGHLNQAVATLKAQVPPVAEQPEYRVTLATLLQQQGQGQEAAAIWAELIAWDDSRAPWWVGLAIALEDQGETRSATRAYEQAAALPGLPPSLADYVQRRLRSLRAG